MYVDARDNYSETELKKQQVFASSGSLTPREAAGMPGKAASDSRLLPRLIYKWLFAYKGSVTIERFGVFNLNGSMFKRVHF